jgi:hypothetical protein
MHHLRSDSGSNGLVAKETVTASWSQAHLNFALLAQRNQHLAIGLDMRLQSAQSAFPARTYLALRRASAPPRWTLGFTA